MKTNSEHHCTHIFQAEICRYIIVLWLLFAAGLWAFNFKKEETSSEFSYILEISSDDVDTFIESGTFPPHKFDGHSFNYEGRQYPVYSVKLANHEKDLALVVKNREILEISSLENIGDLGTLKDSLIDFLDVSSYKDFVSLQELAGGGAMLEIIPILPAKDGRARVLKKAEISLLPRDKSGLIKYDLVTRPDGAMKAPIMEQDLPNEFCALYITEPGFYRVSGKDLKDKGIEISSIDPDNLKLLIWGKEIPIRVTATNSGGNYIFTDNDFVQFYIDKLSNPYGNYRYNPFSKYNVIQLVWDDGYGKRFVQQNSVITGTAGFTPEDNRIFRCSLEFEKNQTFDQLSRLHEEELSHNYEHYFYSPYVSVGNSVEFPFELWDPVDDTPNEVIFTLRMQGLTYNVSGEMDHQIYVTVNNRYCMEDEWEGQQPKISTNQGSPFGHEYLIHGNNNLDISVQGFSDNSLLDDRVYLDWMRVEYDREMKAHENFLQFSPQFGEGRYLFEIRGFTDPTDIMILKDEINWIRGYTVIPEDTVGSRVYYSVYFEDDCDGDEIYTLGCPGERRNEALKVMEPFGVVPVDSIRYINMSENEVYHNRQGDYVIVTPAEFTDGAQLLADHKASIGFNSVVYDLTVLADKFNYSNLDPYAVKRFLSHAYNNWSVYPNYIVFIGDYGLFPTINYQSAGALGSVLADTWFVDVDDDYVMEMSLGRLPVKTEGELDSLINLKIVKHDIEEKDPWINRVGVVTGPQGAFRKNAQDFVNKVCPDNMQTDRLYLYDTNDDGEFNAGYHATDSLLSMMNYGINSLNYLGHGGGYTWDNKVLPYDQFDRVVPENTFLVNSLTCFSNSFSNNRSIGEMFIRHYRGAVSVLGSTGYGWLYSNDYLFQNMSKYLFDRRQSHGDSFRYGMIDFFFSIFGRNIGFYDHINANTTIYKHVRKSFFYQFCILGDPSAAVPESEETDNITASPSALSEGSQLTISVPENNASNGILDITGIINNKRKYPIKQKIPLTFSGGSASLTFPASEGIHDGMLQLSYKTSDGLTHNGIARFSIDAPYIRNFSFYPEKPDAFNNDSAYVRLLLQSDTPVDSVYLKIYQKRDMDGYNKALPLVENVSGDFRSEFPLYYYDENSFYTYLNGDTSDQVYYSGVYFIPVIISGGESIYGDYYFLEPEYTPESDISIYNYSIQGGQSRVELLNDTEEEVFVKISLSVADSGYARMNFSDTVRTNDDVDRQYAGGVDKINTFYFDFLPPYGASTVQVDIEPLDMIDSDTSNNHVNVNVSHKWFYYMNEIENFHSNEIELDYPDFKSIMPSGEADKHQAVFVDFHRHIFPLSQFGGSMVNDSAMYIRSAEGDDMHLIGSVPSDRLQEGQFVAWLAEDTSLCYRLPMTDHDSVYTFPIEEPGFYIYALSNENDNPQIQVNLNARTLLSGGYVSQNSEYSVMVSDNYGVHPRHYTWSVLLNDEEIPQDRISVTGGADIREFGFNFKLDIMDNDDQRLKVTASDLMGNTVETEEYVLKYSGDAELFDYGNYPNPFIIKTTFIYELTEQFDDLEIRIYTLSGQKIYTMSENENAITDLPLFNVGYHEVPWSGEDEFGNKVANGVYFYVIRGEVNGKVVKSTGKIAKLR